MPQYKQVTVRFNDVETKMMEMLSIKKGFRRSEIMRAGLRYLFRKEFPNYILKSTPDVKAAIETEEQYEKMTNEDVCVNIFGGEVVEEGDFKYCKTMDGHIETLTPLDKIKES